MANVIKAILLTVLLLVFVNPGRTAEPPSTSSLQFLYTISLQQNPELKAAYHRWQSMRSAIIHKTAIADPVVNFRHNIEPIQTRTGEQNQVLTISQKLPFPGKQRKQIRLGHQEAEGLRISYDIKLRNLITDIKTTYGQIWFLLNAIEISQAQQKLLETIIGQQAANNSSKSLLPVLKAQSQQAQNANDLITYSELLASQKAHMTALTGKSDLPDSLFAELPALFPPAEKEPLLEETLQRSLEIQAARNQEKLAQSRLSLANYQNKPDFVVGFSRAFTGSRPDLGSTYLQGEGTDAVGVFVQMNLPVWQKKNRSRINEARHAQQAAQAKRQAQQDNVKARFTELWFKLANRQRLTKIYKETILPQAKAAQESAYSTYLNDKTRFADYLETINTFYALKLAATRAELDFFSSATELEKFSETAFGLQETGADNEL
jgi:outer membrane protein TolC